MNTYIDSDNLDRLDTLPNHKALDALFQRYELTAEQHAEQKRLGYADGSTGQANRYKGDGTPLGRAYQAGWHAGLNDAMDDVNDTCIES